MAKKSKRQLERDEQIYEISTMVAGDFELQEVLDRLAAAAVKITNTNNCSIRLLDDEAGDLKMRSTFGLSDEYRNKGTVSKEDPVIKAAFAGEAVVLDDMRVDSRVKYPQAAVKEGLVSQLTVAMTFRNKPIGVLRLYSPQPKRFDKDAIAVARLVAGQCAIAITNAKLYSQALEGAHMAEQMRLGAVIQRRMIPEKAPCVCGLDIAAIYQPCYQVGGDLYDFIRVDDHTIGISIADVIGKGIPAAMMMSMFRGTIRAYADGGYSRHTFEDIIQKLNSVALRECRDGEFITMFMCNIDVKAMKMTYCNCGHEPALYISDGQITELDSGGLVLGVMEDTEHKTETITLKDGDTILLYTDGLIDAMNFDNELWGKERMLEAISACRCCSADQLVRNILGYRRRFVGLARQIDDTSIVAVKIDVNANRPGETTGGPKQDV
jgi:sigma-B regulation protein RsbU (phosphoserine phosphatase)